MMESFGSPSGKSSSTGHHGWWRLLNRYHWFVFVVASLGWLFDTMDQQLFNAARPRAMNDLLTSESMRADMDFYSGLTTSIFLIGWATGGLIFGVMGDRVGRAKTMLLTILLYSVCTGLSALSQSIWDFSFYRFLTGLGVGGEFAVGVALVAEVMPERARPFALALLQALSAVGNVMAALIAIGFGELEQTKAFQDLFIPGTGIRLNAWRAMFIVGTFPALLALVIRRRLKEPERWKEAAEHAVQRQLGSYRELLGDMRWRRRAIVGLLLATSGVIGVWGLGFFTQDLTSKLFKRQYEDQERANGEAEADRDFVRLALRDPAALVNDENVTVPRIDQLLTADGNRDAGILLDAIVHVHKQQRQVTADVILAELDVRSPMSSDKGEPQTAAERQRRAAYLSGEPAGGLSVADHAARVASRSKSIQSRLTTWAGYVLLMFHTAGFFGMYGFGVLSQFMGRRPTFAVAFLAAMIVTAFVFTSISKQSDVFWMVPIMGFCQMTVFGGYAVYFPELFPTRLRSTGTSFCYNVGRFLAASGPIALGLFATKVFGENGLLVQIAGPGGWTAEPFRWAGVTMCAVYLLGLAALPFAPETRGQPLPE